ncbi:MAG: hypothetical protein JSV27_11115 [Candidatus Bathyarchaeota archaeon]|nr:MAG: hypothetical protein JSV27_11115 [Candidatus Bathyarchaeota archaeon]
MGEQIDLNAIERRAYLLYHEDGLIDIIIGVCIMISSLYIYAEMIWLVGSIVAVWLPVYMGAKRKLTFPRIGQVTFSRSRSGRTRNVFFFFLAMNVLGVLLGAYAFTAVSGGSIPAWLVILGEYFPIVIGLIGASLFSFIGAITEIKRFHGYAAVALVVMGSNHFLGVPFAAHLGILGVVILTSGIVQLQTFRRKYPVTEEVRDAE